MLIAELLPILFNMMMVDFFKRHCNQYFDKGLLCTTNNITVVFHTNTQFIITIIIVFS